MEQRPVEEDVAKLLWRISVFEARLRQLREQAGPPPASSTLRHTRRLSAPAQLPPQLPPPQKQQSPSLPTEPSPFKRTALLLRPVLAIAAVMLCAAAAYVAGMWTSSHLPPLSRYI